MVGTPSTSPPMTMVQSLIANENLFMPVTPLQLSCDNNNNNTCASSPPAGMSFKDFFSSEQRVWERGIGAWMKEDATLDEVKENRKLVELMMKRQARTIQGSFLKNPIHYLLQRIRVWEAIKSVVATFSPLDEIGALLCQRAIFLYQCYVLHTGDDSKKTEAELGEKKFCGAVAAACVTLVTKYEVDLLNVHVSDVVVEEVLQGRGYKDKRELVMHIKRLERAVLISIDFRMTGVVSAIDFLIPMFFTNPMTPDMRTIIARSQKMYNLNINQCMVTSLPLVIPSFMAAWQCEVQTSKDAPKVDSCHTKDEALAVDKVSWRHARTRRRSGALPYQRRTVDGPKRHVPPLHPKKNQRPNAQHYANAHHFAGGGPVHPHPQQGVPVYFPVCVGAGDRAVFKN